MPLHVNNDESIYLMLCIMANHCFCVYYVHTECKFSGLQLLLCKALLLSKRCLCVLDSQHICTCFCNYFKSKGPIVAACNIGFGIL